MAVYKKALDKILKTKFVLSDGKLGNAFTVHESRDHLLPRYSCRLCSTNSMPALDFIQHVKGKKHRNKQPPFSDAATRTKALSPIRDFVKSIEESGTTGTTKNSQIQLQIGQIKDQAIVGLEYVLAVSMGENFESVYHCILCESKFKCETVIGHITAYVHRSKYLKKHFPTVFKEISHLKKPEEKSRFTEKVCEGIDRNYGRLDVMVVENNDFTKNRMKYTEDVLNTKHFDEHMGPKFVELIDKSASEGESLSSFSDFNEDNLSRRASLDSISTSSASYALKKSQTSARNIAKKKTLVVFRYAAIVQEHSNPLSQRRRNKTQHKSDGIISLSSSPSASPSPRPTLPKKEKLSPILPPLVNAAPVTLEKAPKWKPVTDQASNTLFKPNTLIADSDIIQEQTYKMEKFRLQMNTTREEVKKKYEVFLRTPANHPDYTNEWNIFWARRYKELRDENKVDPKTYDFKQEWLIEWKKLLNEKMEKEIDAKKTELKETLKINDLEVAQSKKVKSQLSEDIHVIAMSIIEKARKSKLHSTEGGLHKKPLKLSKNKSYKKSKVSPPHKRAGSQKKSIKRSRSKTKARSPEKSRSPKRSRSPRTFSRRSRSPRKFRTRSRSPKRSPKRCPSNKRSSKRYRSPTRLLRRSRSPRTSLRRSRSESPKRSPRRSMLSRRSASCSRSPRRSHRRSRSSRSSRSPRRSPRRLRSPWTSTSPRRNKRSHSPKKLRLSVSPERLTQKSLAKRRMSLSLRKNTLMQRYGSSPHFNSCSKSPENRQSARISTLTRNHHKREYEKVCSLVAPIPPRISRDISFNYYNAAESKSSASEIYIPKKSAVPVIDPDIDEPITIISVLRLLTALEDILGSLGPKVMELMTKAVTMNKVKANSSNLLLDDDDHCVIFETVKEKLKGLLSAGMVTANQINTVKNVIKNMAKLLYEANERQKTHSEPSIPTSSVSSQVASISSSPAPISDQYRTAIAVKITLALMQHGRKDITPLQLDVLVDEYIKMANEPKNKDDDFKNGSTDLVSSQHELDDNDNDTIDIQNKHITKERSPEKLLANLSPKMKPLRKVLQSTDKAALQPISKPVVKVVSQPVNKTGPNNVSQLAPKSAFQSLQKEVAGSSVKIPKMCPPPSKPKELMASIDDLELKILITKFDVLSQVEKQRVKEYVEKLKKEDPKRIIRLINENPNLHNFLKTHFGLATLEKSAKTNLPSKVQIPKPGAAYSPRETCDSDNEENTTKTIKSIVFDFNSDESDDSTDLSSSIASTLNQIEKINKDLNQVKTGMKIPVVNSALDTPGRIKTATAPQDPIYTNQPPVIHGSPSRAVRPYNQGNVFQPFQSFAQTPQQSFVQPPQQSFAQPPQHNFPQQYQQLYEHRQYQQHMNAATQMPMSNQGVNYFNQSSIPPAMQPQFPGPRFFQYPPYYQHPPY